MKKILTFVWLLLAAAPALGQWQVPTGSIPVGKGPGASGFNSVTGSGGSGAKCLLDTVPPSFGTCSVSNLLGGNNTWTGTNTYNNTTTLNGATALNGKTSGAGLSFVGAGRFIPVIEAAHNVSITIASPAVITQTAHGYPGNTPVKFDTNGALPTGLVVGTTYYIIPASITTNTFQVSATVGGAAINTSGTQSGQQVNIVASTNVNAKGEFIRMQFCPYNGNRVMISGVLETIPYVVCVSPGGLMAYLSSACVNKTCGTTLSPSTSYYVGVYMLSGVMTMNFWPVSTGYVADTTYGNYVKADDPTTSLIGVMYVGPGYFMTGSASTQDSASWFNRVRISILNSVSNVPFTNTTIAELNSNRRLHWVSFSEDIMNISAACTVSNNTGSAGVTIGIGLDSGTVPAGATGSVLNFGSANYLANATTVIQANGNDGAHYAAFLANVSAGTGTITSCQMISTPLPS